MTLSLPHRTTQINPLTQLEAWGLAFTRCLAWDDLSRGESAAGKAPVERGWQTIRHDAAQALSHIAMGGNVGVLLAGQPDGSFLYAFDADSEAARLLAVAPELRGTLAAWRDSGSSKYLFRCDVQLAKHSHDPGGEHAKQELLVAGQAIVAGRHASGQTVHCNFRQPITLPRERVAEIWRDWTGQPFDAPRPVRQEFTRPAGDADYDLVASAVRALRPSRADGYDSWRNVGFSLKAWGGPGALELFHEFSARSEKYDPRTVDKAWHGFRSSGITIGSLIHMAVEDAGADALAWPVRADRPPDNATPESVQRYESLRQAKAHADSFDCLGDLRQALRDNGLSPRGAEACHRVWQHLTGRAVTLCTPDLKHISARQVATAISRSHTTVGAALERLQAIGWATGGDGVLSLSLPHKSFELSGKVRESLRSTLNDDIFAPGTQYVVAQRRRSTQGPLLPALGPMARYLVAALRDGPATAQELASTTNLALPTVYRALDRLESAGLTVETGRIFALVPDFDAKIDAMRPQTVNFGLTMQRSELFARERLAHLARRLAIAQEAERARLERAQAKADRTAREIGAWLELAGLHPLRGAPWGQMRAARQRHLGQLDEKANYAAFKADAKRLRRDKRLTGDQFLVMGRMAGFTEGQVLAAWRDAR